MTQDERQIRALRAEWQNAVQSRDLDRTMATYYPGEEYLGFDVMPPFSFEGWESFRQNWITFFEMFDEDPVFEFKGMKVHCSGDVAFTTGFTRFMGSVAGNKIDLWTRETIGLRKLDGQWLMIHDHVSVPIDLKTGAGVTDYRP
ncbi:nuclear transport factor 2 family protein [Salinisphaera sp. T31B1]|uniref:YybH family protein n=1 Tax=Salinisphaera sp. T31B1 TaxID=727963 RepID=UPI0033405021